MKDPELVQVLIWALTCFDVQSKQKRPLLRQSLSYISHIILNSVIGKW